MKPSTQDNSEKLKRLQLLISLNNDLSETLSKSTIPNTPIVNRIFAVQRTLWLEIGELCEEILPIDDMTKLKGYSEELSHRLQERFRWQQTASA